RKVWTLINLRVTDVHYAATRMAAITGQTLSWNTLDDLIRYLDHPDHAGEAARILKQILPDFPHKSTSQLLEKIESALKGTVVEEATSSGIRVVERKFTELPGLFFI